MKARVSATASGSPPRARGRQPDRRLYVVERRFTPAGAGTAARKRRPTVTTSVHPRGRGDGTVEQAEQTRRGGSPPRARGRRRDKAEQARRPRFTPAGAGTATRRPYYGSRCPVHPRGRGDGLMTGAKDVNYSGSPPRARGRRDAAEGGRGPRRFTPAGAGTAPGPEARGSPGSVHPRGRGDGVYVVWTSVSTRGSPPRARGRPRTWPRPAAPVRFTPAGAGTASSASAAKSGSAVHPRGRGDGRHSKSETVSRLGSPPRARGRPGREPRRRPDPRFTPAGAGTAPPRNPGRYTKPVHPRGRGDGETKRARQDAALGSPPRARGRPVFDHGTAVAGRFTPAGAGTACRSRPAPARPAVHPRGRGDGQMRTTNETQPGGSPPRARGRPGDRRD